MSYGADGHRRSKKVTPLSGPASDTIFVYDGQNLMQERDGTGLILANYTWGPDRLNTEAGENWAAGNIGDTVLLQRRASTPGDLTNGTTHYFGTDPSANIRLLIEPAGTVAGRMTYKAFGELFAGSGGILTPFRFGGSLGYFYDAFGRYDVGFRIYDDKTGRWISIDPIGFDGGLWNLYGYVGNDPVRLTDASGLATIEVCFNPINIPGATTEATNHAFILITDGDKKYYVRGGRAADCPRKFSKCPRNVGCNIPGIGRMGPVTVCSGAYVAGTPDWVGGDGRPPKSRCITVKKDSVDGEKWMKKLQAQGDRVNRACLTYHPLGPNSNSSLRYVIRNSGLPDIIYNPLYLPNDPDHAKVNLPGWNTPILCDKPPLGTDPPFDWTPAFTRAWLAYLRRLCDE